MLTLLGSGTVKLQAKTAFPGLTDVAALSGAQNIIENYSAFTQAFSNEMVNATIFAGYLGYPFAIKSSTLYIGFGLGGAILNSDKIKAASTDTEITSDSIPPRLGSLNMAINLGFGISKKFDLYFSLLPNAKLALPKLGDITLNTNIATAKVRLDYNIFPSEILGFGLTVSPYLAWSRGAISMTKQNLNVTDRDFSTGSVKSTVTNFTYDAIFSVNWHFLSGGGEIRVWYDLIFIFPYMGLGLGGQTGLLDTNLTLEGNIDIDIDGTKFNSTTSPGIGARSKPALFNQRFFLGFEIKFPITKSFAFPLRLGAELHWDIGQNLFGAALSIAFQF